MVERVGTEASACGRADPPRLHGLQIWVGFDEDRSRARERLARRMQGMYRIPFERFEKYSPCGTPEEVAEFLLPYVEKGCGSFNVMPVAESPELCVDGVAELSRALAKRI